MFTHNFCQYRVRPHRNDPHGPLLLSEGVMWSPSVDRSLLTIFQHNLVDEIALVQLFIRVNSNHAEQEEFVAHSLSSTRLVATQCSPYRALVQMTRLELGVEKTINGGGHAAHVATGIGSIVLVQGCPGRFCSLMCSSNVSRFWHTCLR